jgi:micrococcal nuclease
MYTYDCEILRVIDGDTLYVKMDLGFHTYIHEYIRLIDVDTAEIFGPNASPDGKVAKEFVVNWVKDHETFTWSSIKYNQREKYGRSLGTLFRKDDPISLNHALKLAGLTA